MASLSEAVAAGGLRAQLEALRDLLIDRIGSADAKETAPLAKQLADVMVRLDSLPAEQKSELDDFLERKGRAKVS